MTVSVATGWLLWGRAVVLSAVALSTGAAAHVQADGLLPSAGVLVALASAGTLACAPLLRRPGSTRRIVLLMVAGQSVVHLALAATAGHRGDPVARSFSPDTTPVTADTGSRSGTYFDVAYAARVGDQGGDTLTLPAPFLHAFGDISAHPTMAVAHLLAAAACGWWLAMGERALWILVALASRAWTELVEPTLRRWVTAARAAAASALSVEVPVLLVAATVASPQSQVRSRSVSRRGPPRAD